MSHRKESWWEEVEKSDEMHFAINSEDPDTLKALNVCLHRFSVGNFAALMSAVGIFIAGVCAWQANS